VDTSLIVRTHQDSGLWVGRGGRIEGPRAELLRKALAEAGAVLAPVAAEPPQRLRRRAAGERAIADMACYFTVRAPADALGTDLADRLREAAEVEFAYVKPPVALPIVPSVADKPIPAAEANDDLRPRQGYLAPPPAGIGAEAAWELEGGRGAGVRIIDVEADWRFSHEDLPPIPRGLIGGRPTGDLEARNHGTNVIGILNGVHNGRGIHGICPDAAVRGYSYQPEHVWGSARAIKAAADTLRPGDILLVEMQRPGPRTPDRPPPGELAQTGYLPMEYWPDDMTAIQYAVSIGIVVVAAAGNGAQDLDDAVYAGPGPGFREQRPNPFARQGLDSGAVLVGAGAPPDGAEPDRSRLQFSNWGSALDAQGWGKAVATTGGLGPGADKKRPGEVEDRWYTERFNGTSSAAPIVAGALACVQGVLRAAGRRPLRSAEARAALRETGSPQQPAAGGSLERIGNRPDVARLIEWAMERAPRADETPTDSRRRSMRVTITIEDDDGGAVWQTSEGTKQTYVKGPYIKGPYIKGPSLFIPLEDGSELELDINALPTATGPAEESG
jgi:Subtilase family